MRELIITPICDCLLTPADRRQAGREGLRFLFTGLLILGVTLVLLLGC